jgi:hypothetical protein
MTAFTCRKRKVDELPGGFLLLMLRSLRRQSARGWLNRWLGTLLAMPNSAT